METAASAQRFPLRFLAMVGVYALGVNFVWISYTSIVLPLQAEAVASPERKGVILGVVAGVSIAAGIMVNILSGILSDHSASRWGRRTPYLIGGALLTLPCILVTAVLPLTVPLILLSFLGIQVFSNLSAGAFQPLLADIVPQDQRGTAAGFQGVFNLSGAALGFGLVTALASEGRLSLALVILAFTFLGTTMLQGWIIKPYDRPLVDVPPISLVKATVDIFRPQRRSGTFFWYVLASFLIFVGISSFQFFGLYYFETVLRSEDPVRTLQVTGLVNLLVSMVAAVITGLLSDRTGRRNMLILGAGVAGVVCLFFPFMKNFAVFLAFAAVYAATSGLVFSVGTSLATILIPLEEAGKYMAYYNLSVGVANSLAAPLFGAILNLQGAPTMTSFVIFFSVAAASYFLSCVVLVLRVPSR